MFLVAERTGHSVRPYASAQLLNLDKGRQNKDMIDPA